MNRLDTRLHVVFIGESPRGPMITAAEIAATKPRVPKRDLIFIFAASVVAWALLVELFLRAI